MSLIETKIRFTPTELAELDAAAAAAGTSRSAFVRDRVTNSDSGGLKLTPAAYHRLVSDTSAFMRGDLNRNHIETLVAYVIRRLSEHQPEAEPGDQPAP